LQAAHLEERLMLIALLHASPVEHTHYDFLAMALLVTVAIGVSVSLFRRLGERS
jgi:hypothetical protein